MPNRQWTIASPQVRGLALVVVWSSGFVGAELGARHAGPDTLLAWRFLATAVLLLPWLRPALAHLDRRGRIHQGVLALLSQCLYLGGTYWAAAAGVPAGTSALIASLQPALVIFLSSRRLRPRHLAGLALGTGGVMLTAVGDLRAGVTIAALVLPLAAMLSLTAGTMLQERRPSPPLMQTLAVQALISAAFFTVYTAAAGNLAPPMTAGFWAAVAWGTAAGIGSYGLYYLITSRDGASRASTLLYLTPATTALWAAPMFGQPIRGLTVLGLLISASAVFLLRDAAVRPGNPGASSPAGPGAAAKIPL
ncbi:DMT family transporter [Kineosporia rhizophila]|uniref:DMT family transporter n=1 Tax=Kineosporia rhizophila TaxID=84633 RepID=UPI001E645E11|nr:DMT family transporter [Kineosporia rhizophila]MCE0536246.1 DMT family transporter [Kineosporia rhizophila]